MAHRLPPGPRPRGWLGSLSSMRRDPIRLLLDSVGDYGEIVHFRMLHRHVVVLAAPDHVRHVFQDNYQNYSKQTPGFKVLRTFLANGLLTNEGDAWLRQRRIAQPAFHRDRIAGFADTITTAAEALADRWNASDHTVVNLTAEMTQLTLRIVGETLLSTDVSREVDRIGQALTVSLRAANRSITRVVEVPQWVPTPTNRRLHRALTTLDSVVYEMIAARRRSGEDTGDLLSMLMAARDEDTGEGMSDRQLRDEVMTIFLAGHETTAIALGWTWHLLSKHPTAAQRLRDELATVLAGRAPRLSDLPQLVYTDQVIKESLRLFPPAWIISRCAIETDHIGGFDIPAGTIIFTSPYVTHRQTRLWDNPWAFNPERFGSTEVRALPPFAYFPFGGGPRQCIGNTFAMMEMVLVIATLAQRYRFDLGPGAQPGVFPAITLRPSAPIRLVRHAVTPGDRDGRRSQPALA